ncbi:putative member of glyoxalase/bleomycin resistance protein family [Staphylococcus piscifermentans]|uniref:Extradiol dioxygenase n=1 Tax=Staphylococcus piscifermentans TaxID=70258 RepID=A0A239U5K7_9STAP|nr:VOC family protein [Staphylococcus piscifermentans]RTX82374.1 member of glyoxalase/bleomycin resistance protein family [Staphylococcus piscifermentans]GEP84274.1 extradiol dioxygenase [Staphylococcus piscifermentans]SNV05307.1 putative member of glyoxalase/bleomycin resistance protein family [Staphylococcus piscifermentans]
MLTNIWFNLGCDDLEKSMKFYKDIGFTIIQQPEQEGEMFGFKAQTGSPVMVVSRERFKQYIGKETTGNDVLISLSVKTEEEADKLAKKVEAAGGVIKDAPKVRNNFYGFSFQDIDGHFFNIIVMA